MRVKARPEAGKVERALAVIINTDLAQPDRTTAVEGWLRLAVGAREYFTAQHHLFDLVNDEDAERP